MGSSLISALQMASHSSIALLKLSFTIVEAVAFGNSLAWKQKIAKHMDLIL